MPTRFYFPFVTPSDVTPATNGVWNQTGDSHDRKLVLTKVASAPLGEFFAPNAVGWLSNQTTRLGRYVSDPMPAGISFNAVTVLSYCQTWEIAAADNCRSRLEVYIVDLAGSTVQHTLLAIADYSTGTEWSVLPTIRNKAFADGDTVAGSYTTVAGDRLVVVLGGGNAAGTSPEGAIEVGNDSAIADCEQNETGTATRTSWIEFSNDIIFPTEAVAAGAGTSTSAATGAATAAAVGTSVGTSTAAATGASTAASDAAAAGTSTAAAVSAAQVEAVAAAAGTSTATAIGASVAAATANASGTAAAAATGTSTVVPVGPNLPLPTITFFAAGSAGDDSYSSDSEWAAMDGFEPTPPSGPPKYLAALKLLRQGYDLTPLRFEMPISSYFLNEAFRERFLELLHRGMDNDLAYVRVCREFFLDPRIRLQRKSR